MKILLGISGGLDSAYSALLLRDAGHTVETAVLDMHQYTEVSEAKNAAEALNLPFHIISCRDLFEKVVVSDFCDAYMVGNTPNPCVICNERVKFRVLYDYAMAHGFDAIATGHYARIVEENGRFFVAMASDKTKDQSYMLYRLPQQILGKMLFPMGNIIKKEAKADGARRGLLAAEREESQEICFVRDENYADYIERLHGPSPEGEFVDEEGSVLGRHRGIIRYTIGQRKGLGVSAASRLFVQEINVASNQITLSKDAPRCQGFLLDSPVFSGMTLEEALASEGLRVRVRYTAPLVAARVISENGMLRCILDEENKCALTPGQSAVFYFGDRVAFGGIIRKVL